MEQSKEGSFLVPLNEIVVLPNRGRKSFTNLPELMKSIEDNGLIHPVVVTRRESDGKFVLVAGERRLRALGLLGRNKIPCTFKESLSEVEQKAIELEENLRRENLAWDEEAELLAQLDELMRSKHGDIVPGPTPEGGKTGWSVKKTAEMLGRSRGAVSDRISLAKALREDPGLKKVVGHLPVNAAMRKVSQLTKDKETKRLVDIGAISIYASLKQGDARKLIKDIEPSSISLVITDPPFGIEIIEKDNNDPQRGTNTNVYRSTIEPSDNLGLRESLELQGEIIKELSRVMIPGGHLYLFTCMDAHRLLVECLRRNGFSASIIPLIWLKPRTTSVFYGYEYAQCYEPIIFAHKEPRQRRLNKPCSTVLQFGTVPTGERIHAFEKPQDLLRFLIKQSSSRGETILDPFAGSGSVLRAAIDEGRKAIGFEISEGNYLRAQKALNER